MKNHQASSRFIASIWRRSLVSVMVCNILAGCATLAGSNRIEIPANTGEFRSRLYTGAAVGNSHLTPDTQGTAFNVESSDDIGTQLRLGYDVHNLLAVELDTSVLGTSRLQESGTDVKYSAATLSALIYGLSGVQLRSRREGLSAYGRIGYGALKKSSAVLALEESGTVPVFGLGAEYGFSNGLGVRAEVTRFDSDAAYVGFGAVYRFGISPAGIGNMIAEAAEPALASADSRVAPNGRTLSGTKRAENYGPADQAGSPYSTTPDSRTANQYYAKQNSHTSAYTQTVADRWRPPVRTNDTDGDGILNNVDSCPDTRAYVTVDQYGCGLFDAVLEDVTFKSGSLWLSPRARGQLDLLAETLLAFPESRVQIRAHTDSSGAADANLSLSSRRAEVVVKYLQSRGVHELQLQAAGMGEAQPLDTNGDPKSRRRNRRVDVVTLPDQDAGQLLVATNFGSARVLTISDPGKRQPGRDDYSEAEKEWNIPRSSQAQRKAMPPTLSEPGLLAANPGAKVAQDDTAAASSAETADKPTTTNKKSGAKRVPLIPIPEPGFAPGMAVAGIIEGLNFAPGSYDLTDEAKQKLAPILDALRDNPEVRIAVMAHTDDTGDSEVNKTLSLNRANAVVDYLVLAGIDAGRVSPEGYGELLPLVQNVSEEDRARNRRIEIRVLPMVDK